MDKRFINLVWKHINYNTSSPSAADDAFHYVSCAAGHQITEDCDISNTKTLTRMFA